MRIEKQIAIFLDNRPGLLARLCEDLAAQEVNIVALTVADSLDYAIVRMIVDNFAEAEKLIRQKHHNFHFRDVVVCRLPNRPGTLADLADRLSAAGINIEYAYASGAGDESTVVLRTNDLEGTINTLS